MRVVPVAIGAVVVAGVGYAIYRLLGGRDVSKKEGSGAAKHKAESEAGGSRGGFTEVYAQTLREEQVKAAATEAIPASGTDQSLQTWFDRVKSEYETMVAAMADCPGRFGKEAWAEPTFNDSHLQAVWGPLFSWRALKKPKPDNAWAELAAIRTAIYAGAFTVHCKKSGGGKGKTPITLS